MPLDYSEIINLSHSEAQSLPHPEFCGQGEAANLDFCINLNDLEIGDVILTTPHRKRLTYYGVRLFQLLSKSTPRRTKWTHASLYIGSGFVVETDKRKGVFYNDLESIKKHSKILVRRHSSISEFSKQRIPSIASTYKGKKYGRLTLAGHFIQFIKPISRSPYFDIIVVNRLRRKILNSQTYTCSELCTTILARSQVNLLDKDDFPLTPSELASSEKLEDVKVGWWHHYEVFE